MERLKLRIGTLLFFIFTLLFDLWGMYHVIKAMIKERNEIFILFILVMVLLIVFIPPFWLSISYLFENLNKKIFIDKQDHSLYYKRRGEIVKITREDIVEAYFVTTPNPSETIFRIGIFYHGYEYILLVLKEREKIYITNLLSAPKDIISLFSLNYTEVKVRIPFIDRGMGSGVLTTEELESKIQSFEQSFQYRTEEDLRSIIRQKTEYAEYAREAAKRILAKRNKV